MEHLPLKPGGNCPITIPYLPTAPQYDNGLFLEYPARMGWDFSLWRTFDTFSGGSGASLDVGSWLTYNRMNIDELPPFLQTWLFFGLLSSVLNADIPLEDFVRRDIYSSGCWITTKELGRYLEEWGGRVNGSARTLGGGFDRNSYLDAVAEILCCADAVARNVARVVVYGGIPEPWQEQLEGVQFCASLLIRALAGAVEKVLGRHVDVGGLGRRGRMPLLERRMEESGWCPFVGAVVGREFAVDVRVYVYMLGTDRVRLDHSRCGVRFCGASNVGEGYRQRHVRDGCGCEIVRAPVDEVVEVLKRGGIPLMTVSYADGKPVLNVVEKDDETPYITISHVWTDGLGDPFANTILACQLTGISKSLENIASNNPQLQLRPQQSLPFYLDTLCNPAPPSPPHDSSSLRTGTLSLRQTHTLHTSSHGTLILDPDCALLSPSSPFHEVICRLALSTWNTRLWTYLESALAPRLFVRGTDGCVFDIEDLIARFRNGEFEDGVASEMYREAYVTYRVCIPRPASLPKLDLNPPNSPGSSGGALSPRHQNPDRDSTSDIPLQHTLRALAARTTTHPASDELFVLAALLNLPLGDGGGEEGGAGHLQMPTLLSSLWFIPLNALFSHGPRLQVPGFRWAPASILAMQGGGVGEVVPELVPGTLEASVGESLRAGARSRSESGAETGAGKEQMAGLGNEKKQRVGAGGETETENEGNEREGEGMVHRPLAYLHKEGKGLAVWVAGIWIKGDVGRGRDAFLVDVGAGEVLRVGILRGATRPTPDTDIITGTPHGTAIAAGDRTSTASSLIHSATTEPRPRPKSFSFSKPVYVILLASLFHDSHPSYTTSQMGVLAEVVGKTRDPSLTSRRFSFRQVALLAYREAVNVERTSRTGDFSGAVKWTKGEMVGPKWWVVD